METVCGVTHTPCQQWPFGSHFHTLNYFVMSCPVLRSLTFLSFGNKFSSKRQNLLFSETHSFRL